MSRRALVWLLAVTAAVSIVAAGFVLAVSGAGDETTVNQILARSGSQVGPWRFALAVYLRVAAMVWITVEWIAAVVLLRGLFIVRRHFPPASSGRA